MVEIGDIAVKGVVQTKEGYDTRYRYEIMKYRIQLHSARMTHCKGCPVTCSINESVAFARCLIRVITPAALSRSLLIL